MKNNDNKNIGEKLDLYSKNEQLGQGLALFHPKGGMIRYLMEEFSKKAHLINGYEIVYSPNIGKKELFEISGHLENFKELMFSPLKEDNDEYYLKPMSCPFHVLIYNNSPKSYNDLPIRYFEFANVYRYEFSGGLQGLSRLRGFMQDDAHIICSESQAYDEIVKALQFSLYILRAFGFNKFKAYIATKPAKKSIGDDDLWELAIESLKKAVKSENLDFEIDEGGGAFYGPKIDIKLFDSSDREWQCSTIQYDFNIPERFDMKYSDNHGEKQVPIMVHRALFGSVERFLSMLIEYYSGRFPFWLSPVQIGVVSISDRHNAYVYELRKKLLKKGFRVEVNVKSDTLNAKIRNFQNQKLPIILIIGDREVEESKVSVRSNIDLNLSGSMDLDELLSRLNYEQNKGIPEMIMENEL